MVQRAGTHHAAVRIALAQCQADERADIYLKDHKRRHRIGRQQKGRNALLSHQSKALDGAGMHGHAGGIDITKIVEDLADGLGASAAHCAGDNQHLAAGNVLFQCFADAARLALGNAHAVHLRPGFAGRGGQGIRVHVKNLAQCRFLVQVNQLAAKRNNGNTRPRVHQHL